MVQTLLGCSLFQFLFCSVSEQGKKKDPDQGELTRLTAEQQLFFFMCRYCKREVTQCSWQQNFADSSKILFVILFLHILYSRTRPLLLCIFICYWIYRSILQSASSPVVLFIFYSLLSFLLHSNNHAGFCYFFICRPGVSPDALQSTVNCMVLFPFAHFSFKWL